VLRRLDQTDPDKLVESIRAHIKILSVNSTPAALIAA